MRAKRNVAVVVGFGLFSLFGMIVPASVQALHRETPGAVQVSSGVSHQHPSGRSWGNYFAFASSQDLASTGNTTRQIFVFNLADHDCAQGTTVPTTPCPPPGTPALRQVTVGPGAPDNPSAGKASTSGDQWVAFDALGSFTGGGALLPLTGPAATRRQIFLKNLRTGEFRRVTTAADGDSVRPSVNSLAGIIVFESTATLGGYANPAGVSQVFLYERASSVIRRLSVAPSVCGPSHNQPCPAAGPSTLPVTNNDGKRVVFQSTADLLGAGHNTGVSQIYYADYDKVTHTHTLRRLTNGNGDSGRAFVAETKPVVVFDSMATNLPNGSGVAGRRVVVTDVTNPASPVMTELTAPSVFGDCGTPTLTPGSGIDDARVAMICTGDPLQNGTTGNRVFVYDLGAGTLYQITGAGDVQSSLGSNLGTWFLTLSTSSDLSGDGVCGYQLYVINYNNVDNPHSAWNPATALGQLPPDAIQHSGSSAIGLRTFAVAPGTTSETSITTRDGTTSWPLTASASIGLTVSAPDVFNGQAQVSVPADRLTLPPVPVSGFGAICFSAAGSGSGMLDCDGGAVNANVLVQQDHNTDDSDPFCLAGCRENDAVCQGTLPGPHIGEAAAVCNGPMNTSLPGAFVAGGARVSVPVRFSFSIDPGLDGVFCNGNDTYAVALDVPATLWLTTGSVTGRVLDRDNVIGETLETVAAGAAFDCNRLRAGDLAGTRLVGAVPILDVPNVPGLRDILVGFSLEAAPSAPNSCGASCNTTADCDDGNFCNGQETCGPNRICVAGTAPTCDDGDQCNGFESCDPQLGCVDGAPCNDGNPCNGAETCSAQTGCQAGTPILCSDGDACNGLETCNPTNGACVPGTSPTCDDGNACTNDSCDPGVGCRFMNNTHACDDGDACTQNDVCGGGSCGGTLTPAAVACNAGNGNACDGAEACNPATGACEAAALDCNDQNPCTDDGCNPQVGCQYVNNTSGCTDGDACTVGDVCQNGTCASGTPTVCTDGNACNGVESCNSQTGACQAGAPPTCDDGDPCTDDACSASVGCVTTFNTAPCEDGNACTGTAETPDRCSDGVCESGSLLSCSDDNACTGVETCDPESGCRGGQPLACDDQNPCTDDSCDPQTGCRHANNTTVCDDGNACTVGDACHAGGCEGGTPRVCDDGTFCNGTEICDPATGCQAGAVPTCDDGNPCTADSCGPSGCEHVNLQGLACSDGNLCTTGDVCQAGTCVGAAVSCTDGDVCDGTETCDPQTGACHAGTPLSCDDGDACTIDNGCDATAGCGYTRVPNFIVCRITALLEQVRAMDPTDLGGRRRQTVLVRRLGAARRKAQVALIGSGNRSLANLQRARTRVQSFIGVLQQGMLRGRVEATRGNRLTGLAADAISEIGVLTRSR